MTILWTWNKWPSQNFTAWINRDVNVVDPWTTDLSCAGPFIFGFFSTANTIDSQSIKSEDMEEQRTHRDNYKLQEDFPLSRRLVLFKSQCTVNNVRLYHRILVTTKKDISAYLLETKKLLIKKKTNSCCGDPTMFIN